MKRQAKRTEEQNRQGIADLVQAYGVIPEGTRQEGREWYPKALEVARGIAATSGRETVGVVYAIAALSPRTKWNENITMARDLAKRVHFKNPGTFLKLARKAWACLHGEHSEAKGPKTEAFAACILGDGEAVVIDVWMMRVFRHHRDGVSPKQYETYAGMVREAAHQVGERPCDLQAMLWIAIRGKGE